MNDRASDVIDAVVVGGGPAGLNAALAMGRARRSVLLCDGGTPRNARAEEVHTFVTRDGTPPAEFRRIAREQLRRYETVTVRDQLVQRIVVQEGKTPRFTIHVGDAVVEARRVILATGMIDVLPSIPGVAELWGTSVFQCPYCHGFEHRDQPFAVLAEHPMIVEWAPFLRAWSKDVIVFTNGALEVSSEVRAKVAAQGVTIEERRIAALHGEGGSLRAIELADGHRVARSVVFYKPSQRQVPLVAELGLALTDLGEVKVDERGATSIPGIFAGGDLTTMKQSAILAAGAGTWAASMATHELVFERIADGSL